MAAAIADQFAATRLRSGRICRNESFKDGSSLHSPDSCRSSRGSDRSISTLIESLEPLILKLIAALMA